MDDVCPWESMEKLPSASEKSASATVPVPIPTPKPSTSAAAAAAFIRSSCSPTQHQLAKKKSEEHPDKGSHRSGPPSKQSSILSKQGSTASQKFDDLDPPVTAQPIERSPLAALQRQESVSSSKMPVKAEKENIPPSISSTANSSIPTLTSQRSTENTVTPTQSTLTNTPVSTTSPSSITSSLSTLIPSSKYAGDKSETSTLKEVPTTGDEVITQSKGRVSRTASKEYPDEKGIGDERRKEVDKNESDKEDNKVLVKRVSEDKGSCSVPLHECSSDVQDTDKSNSQLPETGKVPFEETVKGSEPPIINPVNRKMSKEEDVCPWDHE